MILEWFSMMAWGEWINSLFPSILFIFATLITSIIMGLVIFLYMQNKWNIAIRTSSWDNRQRQHLKLIELTEDNFQHWKLCLEVCLGREGLSEAIHRELTDTDPRNHEALAWILSSISPKMTRFIGGSQNAWRIIQNLECQLGSLDYSQLSRIEEDIRAMRMTEFEEKDITEHLVTINHKIQQLKQGGALVDRLKELNLIAATFPTEWLSLGFTNTFKYGSHSVMEGEAMIRDMSRSYRVSRSFNSKPSFYRDSARENRKEDIKEQDRREGRCYYCHNRGLDGTELPFHRAVECPIKLNKKFSKYLCSFAAINAIQPHDPRPMCQVQINKKGCHGLVDSGSLITVLPDSIIKVSGNHIRRFILADGTTPIYVCGPVRIQLRVNDHTPVTADVFVYKAKEAIIGADVLKTMKATINMTDGTISCPDKQPVQHTSIGQGCSVGLSSRPCEKGNTVVSETTLCRPNESLQGDEQSIENCRELVDGEFLELTEGIGLYTGIEHEIDTGNNKPIAINEYRMPEAYLQEMANHVQELLKDGIIEESVSEWRAPWLRVPKKPNGFRMAVDFRRLNDVTKKDTFPMPRVAEILEKLGQARYFSHLDLRKGYYQLMVREQDRPKTAFAFKGKLFQFRRMPFGLCGAPRTFQRAMQRILGDLAFVEIYLDDVAIFSSTLEEHRTHLRTVLNRIKEAGLRLNGEKCVFGASEIEFLGFKIKDGKKIPSDEKKLIFAKFPVPQTSKMLKGFLGLANYVRPLVKDFALLAQPLFEACQSRKLVWTEQCQQNFVTLKKRLAEHAEVYLPDLTVPFMVTCDASEKGMGAVLSQSINGEKRIVEFMSRQFNNTERRYSTIEREATAIWWALRKWQHFLKGVEFVIESDHKPLRWLLSMTDTTPKLSRMAQKIKAEYNIKGIEYIRGEDNLLADTLSRIEIGLIDDLPGTPSSSLIDLTKTEPWRYKLESDRVFRYDGPLRRLVISSEKDKKHILHRVHNEDGHLGIYKCQEVLRRRFYWPKWRADLKQHLQSCIQCAESKDDIEPHREELEPLESDHVWQRLHLDLCGPLSESEGNRFILVAQDAFSKWLEAKSLPKPVNTASILQWLRVEVFSRFGYPDQITTDQGSQFDSTEMKQFCQERSINLHIISSYHHISNGLAERAIRTIETMLRTSVANQADWNQHLPGLLWAYNTRSHCTTGVTPYSLMFGREPRIHLDREFALTTSELDMETNSDKAVNNTKERRRKFKRIYDRKIRKASLEQGELVLWHVAHQEKATSRKLNKKWKGPFEVVSVQRPIAILKDRRDITRRVHLNHIKRFVGRKEIGEFRGRGRPRNSRREV